MKRKELDTKLEPTDRGTVRLVIPFDPNVEWGKKPRHFVKGVINGAAFEGSLGVRGGTHFFPVNKALRKAAGVEAGDHVRISIEPLQEATEKSALPPDLERALSSETKARAFFDTLSQFYRTTYIKWIDGAKQAETRTDRIAKTVQLLKDGRKQR